MLTAADDRRQLALAELVSFCESGVRKIGPTQYEVRHRNWRPARDLHVLIVAPQP